MSGLEERGDVNAAELRREVVALKERNARLTTTLHEARDQIVAMKEEIDRLAQPPSGYGIFVEQFDDGTVDVFTGGRKLRVAVSPEIEHRRTAARSRSHAQRSAQRGARHGL